VTTAAVVLHVAVATVVVAALVILAIFNKISGADAFTGIIAVATAAGVIAGVNTNSSTTTSSTPVRTVQPVTTTAQKG
jgi:hypothetical protein